MLGVALVLSNSIFYHIPKTGGGFVRDILIKNLLGQREIHSIHAKPYDVPAPPRYYTFTFIRNPLSWYQSYWSYRMRQRWRKPPNVIDIDCRSNNFEEFARNCIQLYPRLVSKMYKDFLGSKTHPIDFVGKQEHLVADLIKALTLADEQFDEECIRNAERLNASAYLPQWKELCQYSDDLKAAMVQNEYEALQAYGYWRPEYDALPKARDYCCVS